MEFLIRLFKGFLLIRVQGEQIERFLNLCKHKNISLSNIVFKDDHCLECLISIRDFRKIQVIRRKTFVKIKILRKYGMPFFFLHHKKRKAFFLGIFCMVMVTALLSGRIWNIEVKGNIYHTTPEILKFLDKSGIRNGIKKDEADCSEIVELLRRNYEDVTWASAKLKGSTLTVEIKEGVLIEAVHEEEIPCDLVAEKKGIIVKMVTRSGIPLKKIGDVCEAGEVLVQGHVEILNDSKEVIRTEYVDSDADVYIQYQIPYYNEIPLTYEVYEATGKRRSGIGLQLGKFYVEFGGNDTPGRKNQDDGKIWQTLKWSEDIKLTKSFHLPAKVTSIRGMEYQKVEKEYSSAQAKELAIHELHKYEENLIQKGLQIFVNNVTIKVSQNSCVSHGYLEVIEKIGKKEPIITQTEPNRKDIVE